MKRFEEIIKDKDGFCYIKGVSQDEIDQAEKKLGIKFSGDYVEYLLKYGVATFDGHELTGICSSTRLNVVDVTLLERQNNLQVSNEMYVVEDTCYDGILVWQDNSGAVYETIPGSGIKKVASGLAEYYQNS